jgi:hypothetical protein
MRVGDIVTVKVKNPVYRFKHVYASYVHVPEFNMYTGKLVESHKRDPEDTFRMTGDSTYPVRLIDADRVVAIVVHAI